MKKSSQKPVNFTGQIGAPHSGYAENPNFDPKVGSPKSPTGMWSYGNDYVAPVSTTTVGTGAGPNRSNSGVGKLIASQLAGINRGDPGMGGSLTEDQIRQAAMRRLGG
jgi:hypothetical protein